MCSGAAVGMIASVSGSLMQAQGSMASGNAANQAAKYNAQMMEQNAEISRMQQKSIAEKAEYDKLQLAKDASKVVGEGKVTYAARNVSLLAGSPLDWQADIANQQASEEALIDYNSRLEIWGLENQALSYESQAQLERMKGKSAKSAGKTGALTSILSGGGTAASKYWG